MAEQNALDISINETYKVSREKGFELLYDKYYNTVFFFVLNLSADPHLSFDITQDVFLKAHREKNIMEYNIKAWLYKVAANEFYRNRRSYVSKARYMMKNMFRFLNEETDPGLEFIDKTILDEKKMKLRATLQKLGENDRAVIILKYYDRLSYEEISEILNIETGTVMSRLSRAREKMREMMDDEGE